MSGTAGGLITTLLTLTLLEAVVSTAASAGRVGTLLSGAGTVVAHLSSPSIAAIPDLRPGHNRNGAPHLNGPPVPGTAPGDRSFPAAPALAPPRLPAPANPSIPA